MSIYYCKSSNGTHGIRPPKRSDQPHRVAQSSSGATAVPARRMRIKAAASERLSAIVSGVDPHPLPLAINGAARRRSEAAHARRRKTSEHGAHHVARAAPAARAGSEDDAAVRVHRRRIDQGDTALRSFVPGGGQGRDVRSSSLSRDNSDRKSTRLNSSHTVVSRMPSSA